VTAILARKGFLAITKEVTPGTFLAGAVFLPCTMSDFSGEDNYTPMRDESLRNNDTVLQGLYQGPGHSEHKYGMAAYPDLIGHFFRGIVGPDTVTAGVSTTLASSTIAGATSISTAASIATGKTIKIGTGAAVEYATTGVPSGAGPYTIPIATPAGGLVNAHSNSDPVISQSSHSFAQNPSAARVAYSVSRYNGLNTKGFAGCAFSEVGMKIDPKGMLTFNTSLTGFPSTVPSDPTWVGPTSTPILGWQWTLTHNGVASTRGLSLDLTYKRAVEPIHSSDGTIGPREVFQGAIELDGTLKAVFDVTTDLDRYEQYTQTPMVAILTQPLAAGGSVLTVTMSKSGNPKAKIDNSGQYVTLDQDVAGIWNSTDSGISTITLTNYTSTAY
jgi:hypothetical protein